MRYILLFLVLTSFSVTNDPADIQPDGTLRRIHVPILMYHYISDLPEDADDIRVDLTVTPQNFHEHMAYLRDAGYQTISLDQLYAALTIGAPLPPKPIVITFDDGYVDHYTNAFPILQEFGFTGTFFIITQTADDNNPNHLSWSQIEEMAAAGMAMQSHTKNHPDLRERDYDFLVYQILGSVESLEAHINLPVRMLAYPVGRYDETTLAVTAQSPILLAVTTQSGAYHTTDGVLELSRLRMSYSVGVAGLDQLLRGTQ